MLAARRRALRRPLRHAPTAGCAATFEVIFLTGWAPAPDQPKPLRPGSAAARLADALGAVERSAGERGRRSSRAKPLEGR